MNTLNSSYKVCITSSCLYRMQQTYLFMCCTHCLIDIVCFCSVIKLLVNVHVMLAEGVSMFVCSSRFSSF